MYIVKPERVLLYYHNPPWKLSNLFAIHEALTRGIFFVSVSAASGPKTCNAPFARFAPAALKSFRHPWLDYLKFDTSMEWHTVTIQFRFLFTWLWSYIKWPENMKRSNFSSDIAPWFNIDFAVIMLCHTFWTESHLVPANIGLYLGLRVIVISHFSIL